MVLSTAVTRESELLHRFMRSEQYPFDISIARNHQYFVRLIGAVLQKLDNIPPRFAHIL